MAGTGLTRTRFAPSPTGLLHLGHAFAALTAHSLASPGCFKLRIEDIDTDRCRAEFETAIFEDLAWLGLTWAGTVMRQSERMPAYSAALDQLAAMGLSYRCTCSRGDIRAALSAPQENAPQENAPLPGPDGLVYPGTCRSLNANAAQRPGDVIRLDARKSFAALGIDRLSFVDGERHELSAEAFAATIGDIVLARRAMGTSYHLSVVVDDAAQDISLVTRGADLFDATWIHVLLQRLLGLATPRYHHHRLIRDESGKRLAKRDDARSLRELRENGASPADIRRLCGLVAGASAGSATGRKSGVWTGGQPFRSKRGG